MLFKSKVAKVVPFYIVCHTSDTVTSKVDLEKMLEETQAKIVGSLKSKHKTIIELKYPPQTAYSDIIETLSENYPAVLFLKAKEKEDLD
jgi:hypothetical protein